MPWYIEKRKSGDTDQFCVVKGQRGQGGETVTCHGNRDDALAHLRALYVNEPKMSAVRVGDEELTVLLAETMTERAIGLSGRESLDADGMLFIRPTQDHATFHMRDMGFSLTLAFYDRDGDLVDQVDLEPGHDVHYRLIRPFKYVLELVDGEVPKGRLYAPGMLAVV